ncbi:MAG: CoA transferase [Deltaproteobacteria bacterium]|nr:CoA transferase [Deltaproteobacteria bacterium]
MRTYFRGLKILDFTRLLPGPYATQILADLGATVVKIESPDGGDYARYLPPLLGDVGFMFHALNRNKRSLALDLKNPEAVEALKRLLRHYDTVIESFRSGVMERLGLGYDALRAVRGDIIYISLSGYGATGPMAGRAGHDLNLEALSGMSSVIGRKDVGPVVPGVQVADMASGLFIAMAAASAAFRRATSGEGAYIDLSMADATLSMMSVWATEAGTKKVAPGYGEEILSGASLCYNLYETKDGRHMAVGALEPKFWHAVCGVLGAEELCEEGFSEAIPENPRFRRVREIFLSKTQSEWTDLFSRVNACVEPVLRLDEAAEHALYRARGMVGTMDINGQKLIAVDTPIDPGDADSFTAAPTLGANTREILREAGYEDPEVDRLVEKGVAKV